MGNTAMISFCRNSWSASIAEQSAIGAAALRVEPASAALNKPFNPQCRINSRDSHGHALRGAFHAKPRSNEKRKGCQTANTISVQKALAE